VFCDQCGAQVPEQARFCPSCGKAFGGAPAGPGPNFVTGRVARHLRPLGICWLILSLLRLVPGIVLMGIFGETGRRFFPGMPFFLHGLLSGIGFTFLTVAVLGFAAGWGLLQREPWARMLSLVLGVLNLIEFPIGTGLGIYTLWVLAPAESEREYRQLPRMT
jgi:hypothetical protein